MNNEPEQTKQTQYGQQPSQPYGQPQWDPQQQWNQQPNGQQQWGQQLPPQYDQAQYGPPYGVPPVPQYAQAQQAGQQQTNNFLMRWLMMGIAVRVVLLIVVPLLLCGGCALVVLLSSLAHP